MRHLGGAASRLAALGRLVLGALALKLCAFAVLLSQLVLGIAGVALFVPELGAAAVCGHGALVSALGCSCAAALR